MKRIELFHPRVFSDQEWADGYYKRNKVNIKRVGVRLAQILTKSGFQGEKILDTGCGFGTIAIELAKQFKESEIIGIDLGEPLLELAGSLAEEAGVKDQIQFQKGDVENLEFEDKSFDLVVNTFMMHVVEDPVAMLNEIERVTREDGIIIITDLRRFWLGLLLKKFRTTFTLEEGLEIINRSELRPGTGMKGPFWWDYLIGLE